MKNIIICLLLFIGLHIVTGCSTTLLNINDSTQASRDTMPVQIATHRNIRNFNSNSFTNFDQLTIVATVRPNQLPRRNASPIIISMRPGIYLNDRGWRTSGYGTFHDFRGDVFTANTYFLVSTLCFINREKRFIVNDIIHTSRGIAPLTSVGSERHLELNDNIFHIYDFQVFSGILPLYRLEEIKGAPIPNNAERYPIIDRFSSIVDQDQRREAQINSAFVNGTEFIVTGNRIVAHSARERGNTHFAVEHGDSIFIAEHPTLTTWQNHGHERIRVRNSSGTIGYATFEQLRFNARAEGHEYIRPRITNDEFIREFFVSQNFLGVRWWIALIILIAFIAICILFYNLHRIGRNDYHMFGEFRYIVLPSILLTVGLIITVLGGLIQARSLEVVLLEMRWFFSSFRLLPVGFAHSFVSWALYITIAVVLVTLPILFIKGLQTSPPRKNRYVIGITGTLGMTLCFFMITIASAAFIAAIVYIIAIIVIGIIIFAIVGGLVPSGSSSSAAKNPWRDNDGHRFD